MVGPAHQRQGGRSPLTRGSGEGTSQRIQQCNLQPVTVVHLLIVSTPALSLLDEVLSTPASLGGALRVSAEATPTLTYAKAVPTSAQLSLWGDGAIGQVLGL